MSYPALRNRRLTSFLLLTLILASPLIIVNAKGDDVKLLILEVRYKDGKKGETIYAIPPSDNSMTNPDYVLLPFHWKTTANYYVNAKNKYGLSALAVISTIDTSAKTWDSETNYEVFSYRGVTTRSAGRRDGYNVVSWGAYNMGVIAVTYIWYIGDRIIETDMRLNTYYKWSLNGELSKMDVSNIVTHEFGHWAGLDDLYDDADYWLTMYGYAGNGETYKRTLGLGDINGLEAVYGS